jgi:hypothetical protein
MWSVRLGYSVRVPWIDPTKILDIKVPTWTNDSISKSEAFAKATSRSRVRLKLLLQCGCTAEGAQELYLATWAKFDFLMWPR